MAREPYCNHKAGKTTAEMSELKGNKDQPGPMYESRRRPYPACSYTAHYYFGLHPAPSTF